jgi:hypothetical protein
MLWWLLNLLSPNPALASDWANASTPRLIAFQPPQNASTVVASNILNNPFSYPGPVYIGMTGVAYSSKHGRDVLKWPEGVDSDARVVIDSPATLANDMVQPYMSGYDSESCLGTSTDSCTPSASSTSDDTDSATFSPSPTEHHDGVSSDVVVDSTDDVEEVEHVLVIG